MMNLDKDTLSGRQVVIIGGGPAGLTAAYELTRRQLKPIVLEKADKVGGIARTENYNGYYFDMGGHRFFTKSTEVNQFWQEVLGDDFLLRPRLSRIYYNRKFFNYPLKPLNALTGLGFWQSILVGASYLRWRLFPHRQENTFEQWVTNRFGRRLFLIFFKSYTEKVWGISTSELNAEWAAQRIKDLDLKAAILSMFIQPKNTIKTLIEEFHYPAKGPGMLWNKVKLDVEHRGGEVWLGSQVCGFHREGNRIVSLDVLRDGKVEQVAGTDFISSAPVTEFIKKLNPPPPPSVVEAANQLHYRDFLTVCLIVKKDHLFDDNWIYIHDPNVKVGRIQNFKNWSPAMVPDPGMSSLGLEYFCNEGDELWTSADADLVALGKVELEKIGLAHASDVIDGVVYRVEKSYPVYDSDYRQHLDVIHAYIDGLENFQTIGRNGLHRYNNQDHAMLTGMYAVRNLLFNEKHNLWVINAEQEYHEEIREEKKPDLEKVANEVFAEAFKRMDPLAFGIATALAVGLGLFATTFYLAMNQQLEITWLFWLLGQVLPKYRVTLASSWVGFFYGGLLGFLAGWMLAAIRNGIVRLYVANLRRRAELVLLEKNGYFIDGQSRSSSTGLDELSGDEK